MSPSYPSSEALDPTLPLFFDLVSGTCSCKSAVSLEGGGDRGREGGRGRGREGRGREGGGDGGRGRRREGGREGNANIMHSPAISATSTCTSTCTNVHAVHTSTVAQLVEHHA